MKAIMVGGPHSGTELYVESDIPVISIVVDNGIMIPGRLEGIKYRPVAVYRRMALTEVWFSQHTNYYFDGMA